MHLAKSMAKKATQVKRQQGKSPNTIRESGHAGEIFDVVLSFAGEDRAYVEAVAEFLQKNGVKFFYDKYEEVTSWGKDLAIRISEIYGKEGRYCIPFISKFYAEKAYPTLEIRTALAKAIMQKEEYILPARFDNTEVPGLRPTIAYIDLTNKTPDQFGNIILQKLERISGKSEKTTTEKLGKINKHTPNKAQLLSLLNTLWGTNDLDVFIELFHKIKEILLKDNDLLEEWEKNPDLQQWKLKIEGKSYIWDLASTQVEKLGLYGRFFNEYEFLLSPSSLFHLINDSRVKSKMKNLLNIDGNYSRISDFLTEIQGLSTLILLQIFGEYDIKSFFDKVRTQINENSVPLLWTAYQGYLEYPLSRIFKEIEEVKQKFPIEVCIINWDTENIDLRCTITSMENTFQLGEKKFNNPYRNGRFLFEIKFPPNYPSHPPYIFCHTLIWHPNIDMSIGPPKSNICLDLVNPDLMGIVSSDISVWNSNRRLVDVICAFKGMVNAQPPWFNPGNPSNFEAGQMAIHNCKKFLEKAKNWTERFAME